MPRCNELVWVVAVGLVGCRPQAPDEDAGTGGTGETGTDAGETAPTGDNTAPTSDNTSPTVPGTGDTGLPAEEARPRETPWRTVVDGLPFPAEVRTLTVGREEYDGNFANRGDVEVYFDQDAPVITIEMRVYDFTYMIDFFGSAEVTGSSERFALWAYRSIGDPQKPSAMVPEDDCTIGAWKEGCKVYAYYDGLVAPVRAGVDLRVHLPRSYRGSLEVATEDNLGELRYPRLGDVVVDGLCGSGHISLAQGSAAVKLCRALTPTPSCDPDLVAQCEDFEIDGEAAAWSPLCPCSPDLFGQLKIEARAPWAGDITIDMPDTTWMNVHVANEETELPHACVPEISNCAAEKCVLGTQTFSASAEYNYPGPAAPAGAGYNVTAVAAGCGPVEFFASSEDWVDEDSEPMTAEHGHIRVCSDCL